MNSPFASEKDPISSAGDIITPLMQGSLRPTTPHNTQRYDQRGLVETTYLSIPSPIEKKSADPELPLYLPANWAPFTQPEGQPYFLRSTSLRFVTEDNLYEPTTRLKVEFWTKLIEARLEENQVPPSNNLEVFIKIDDDDCDYYIIDYERRTIFWLTTVGTEELGINAAASQSHLDLALKGLFWSHVEFFPMHFGGLPRQSIDELIGVFSHGYADQMTSNESTFCYGKEDCIKLLGLLKIAREYPHDGYQTCLVARLWSMIYQHRFSTHFGQPLARLGRDQNIIYEVDDNRLTAVVVSVWSLGMAEHFSKSLDNIFVDHFVYADQWRPFISACLQEWKDTLIFTSISLLFQIALSFIPGSQIVATMTALFFLSSIAASLLLILKHRTMDNFSAHSALHYLESVHSEKHQFHFVALVYSLPSVLHLWGTGLLLSNCIVSIYLHFGVIPAVLSGCFVVFGLISSYLILSPASMPSLRSLRRVEVAEDELV